MITPFEAEPSDYLAEERARRFVYPVWTKVAQRLKGKAKQAAYYLGYDISKWQLTADPVIAKGQGMLYTFIRALYGLSVDTKFPLHWGTHKGVIPRGPYLYYLDSLDPYQQAQKFYETCLQNGGIGEMPPVVDVEGINNLTLNAYKIRQCVERVSELFGDVIIYTGFYVWRDEVKGDKAWASAYKLWIAGYPFSDWKPEYFETVKNYPPLIPSPWTKYHVWQFTSKLPASQYGVSGTYLDGNYASQEFYETYLADETPPPDPIGEIVFSETYVTATVTALPAGMNYRNCRTRPDSVGGDAGLIEGKVYLFQTYPCWQSLENAEGTWYLVELPDKAFGWVLGVMPSGVVYITLTQAPIPPTEGEPVPMTPEQLERLEAVEATTAQHELEITVLQNTAQPAMTHKIVTTEPNGVKLDAYPAGGEAVMLLNATPVRLLKSKLWKNQKLYAARVGDVWVSGWLAENEVIPL